MSRFAAVILLPSLLLPGLALAEPTADVAADQVAVAEAAPPSVAVSAVPAMVVSAPGQADAAPTIASPPAAAVATGLNRRRQEDPAAGRAYWADSALVAPRGHSTFEVRMPTAPVIYTGVKYAITDRIEIGASVLNTFGDSSDNVAVGGFTIKGQVWHSDRAAIAIGLNTLSADGDTVYNPYAVGTTCVGSDCNATVSLHLNMIAADGENQAPVLGGVSWAVGRRTQFVGELHQWRDDNGDSLTLGYLGARLGTGKLAFDGGIGFAVLSDGGCSDCSSSSADGGALPFLGMSGRL